MSLPVAEAAAGDPKEATLKSLFTPVSGAHTDGPLCYLLELGKSDEDPEAGFNLLLDCGWSDDLNEDDLQKMIDVLEGKAIDCVLLSGSSINHIGAIPYLVEHNGLSCPILATRPVSSMGWISLYDVHNYLTERTGSAPFSTESIDKSMKLCHSLRFDEKHTLRANSSLAADDSADVFISPRTAGTVLGGCIWHIIRDSYEISYAPQLNHKSERHVGAADLASLKKSNLCIVSADLLSRPVQEVDRDTKMLDAIMSTLRRDGDVLIPVDATGRVLELMLMLEEHWLETYGDGESAPYSLVFYSEYSVCTVKVAEQSLEFTSEALRRRFEVQSMNCLSFTSRGTIKFCKTPEELEDIQGAKVVLATPASCETGYSLDLLLQYCTNPKNTIVVTDKNASNTVVRDLMGYAGLKPGSPEYLDRGSLFAKVHRRVELTPAELDAWRDKEQARLDREQAEADLIRRSEGVKEITDDLGSLSSDAEDDEDDDKDAVRNTGSVSKILGRKKDAESERRTRIESIKTYETREGLFLPPLMAYNSKFLMFPCVDPPTLDYDEYGENLDPELLATFKSIREQTNAAQKDNAADEEEEQKRREWEAREAARPKTVDELDIPKKYEEQQVSADMYARVLYFPFEGLADGNTMRHILKSQCTNAQQIIAVHASEEDTQAMVDYCKSECAAAVFAPRVGETVDVTPQMVTLRVRVDDSLFSKLDFLHVGEYQLAVVEGVLRQEGEEAEKKRRCGNDRGSIPLLTSTPDAAKEGNEATYVGDLKMREFARQLRSEGFKSEVKKSTFLFNSECAVRRGDKGSMALNGTLTADWFKLRSTMLRNYTIL